MNLNVGVNLAKEMNKLARRKKMPYHTYNYSDEPDIAYTTVSKCKSNSKSNSENKGMLKGKSDYYVLAAGVIGAVAALGIAAVSMGNNKKKSFLW